MRLKCKAGEYELSTGMLEAYAALHPTAEQEFAKMVIWLESNSASRPKTPKSAPRFIQNWFKRVPKRVQTKVDQRADTVRQLTGDRPLELRPGYHFNVVPMPPRDPFVIYGDEPEGLQRLKRSIGAVPQ